MYNQCVISVKFVIIYVNFSLLDTHYNTVCMTLLHMINVKHIVYKINFAISKHLYRFIL